MLVRVKDQASHSPVMLSPAGWMWLTSLVEVSPEWGELVGEETELEGQSAVREVFQSVWELWSEGETERDCLQCWASVLNHVTCCDVM